MTSAQNGARGTPETPSGVRNPVDKDEAGEAGGAQPGHEAALHELESLYQELDRELERHAPRCDLSGRCCDFGRFGHELFATTLEVSYLRRSGAQAVNPDVELCPHWVERRCTARTGRPLGCRVFFCDDRFEQVMHEMAERYHARVRQIIDRFGLPYRYGRFVRLAREAPDGEAAAARPT